MRTAAQAVPIAGHRVVKDSEGMEALLLYLDAVTVPVPDLGSGMKFYCEVLGHELIWRNDAEGQAGLSTPRSRTEIVLATRQGYEPDWKVASADAAAEIFRRHGGESSSARSISPSAGWR